MDFGNNVNVDGDVSASGKLRGGGGQASQAGDAILLGPDLKIPTSFYDQGGGGMQKVSYESSQDFIDALRSQDGLFRFSTSIGELEIGAIIWSDAEFRRGKKLPSFGFAYNGIAAPPISFVVCAIGIKADDSITLYFDGTSFESVDVRTLEYGTMSALLF